jgi:hypothetical protein
LYTAFPKHINCPRHLKFRGPLIYTLVQFNSIKIKVDKMTLDAQFGARIQFALLKARVQRVAKIRVDLFLNDAVNDFMRY